MNTGKTALYKRENHSDKILRHREEALSLLASSVKFGIERELYLAAALYNIKMFDLFSSDGISFAEFIKGRKISETSAKRYVRIGKSLASLISNKEYFLTQADLEQYSTTALRIDGKLTLRGLDSATRDLELFRKYLTGEIDEQAIKGIGKSVAQLLDSPVTEVQTPVAIPQVATIIPSAPTSNETLGLEIWKRLESKVDPMAEQCRVDIELYSKFFLEWYPTASPILRDTVTNRVRAIILKLSRLQEVISALYRCDIEDINQAMEEAL